MNEIVEKYLTELWEGMPDSGRDNLLRFEGAINMALKAGLISPEMYELWSYRIKKCPEAPHVDGRVWCAMCGDIKLTEADSETKDGIEFKVASFDEFASVCPYFTSEYDVNNGYGCTHPKQEETDPDDNDIERGKCYNFSCPLGIEPDEEDFENPNVNWDGITRDDCTSSLSGEFMGDEYIMVNTGPDSTEDEKTAWQNYERWINRYNPDWKPTLETNN